MRREIKSNAYQPWVECKAKMTSASSAINTNSNKDGFVNAEVQPRFSWPKCGRKSNQCVLKRNSGQQDWVVDKTGISVRSSLHAAALCRKWTSNWVQTLPRQLPFWSFYLFSWYTRELILLSIVFLLQQTCTMQNFGLEFYCTQIL